MSYFDELRGIYSSALDYYRPGADFSGEVAKVLLSLLDEIEKTAELQNWHFYQSHFALCVPYHWSYRLRIRINNNGHFILDIIKGINLEKTIQEKIYTESKDVIEKINLYLNTNDNISAIRLLFED